MPVMASAAPDARRAHKIFCADNGTTPSATAPATPASAPAAAPTGAPLHIEKAKARKGALDRQTNNSVAINVPGGSPEGALPNWPKPVRISATPSSRLRALIGIVGARLIPPNAAIPTAMPSTVAANTNRGNREKRVARPPNSASSTAMRAGTNVFTAYQPCSRNPTDAR